MTMLVTWLALLLGAVLIALAGSEWRQLRRPPAGMPRTAWHIAHWIKTSSRPLAEPAWRQAVATLLHQAGVRTLVDWQAPSEHDDGWLWCAHYRSVPRHPTPRPVLRSVDTHTRASLSQPASRSLFHSILDARRRLRVGARPTRRPTQPPAGPGKVA